MPPIEEQSYDLNPSYSRGLVFIAKGSIFISLALMFDLRGGDRIEGCWVVMIRRGVYLSGVGPCAEAPLSRG
jgi:hypothetical protein